MRTSETSRALKTSSSSNRPLSRVVLSACTRGLWDVLQALVAACLGLCADAGMARDEIDAVVDTVDRLLDAFLAARGDG